MGSRKRTLKCWSTVKMPVLSHCLTSKISWTLSKISFDLVNLTSTTSWFVRITNHNWGLHELTNTLPDCGHSDHEPEDLQQGPSREPEEDGLAECMYLCGAYVPAASLMLTQTSSPATPCSILNISLLIQRSWSLTTYECSTFEKSTAPTDYL